MKTYTVHVTDKDIKNGRRCSGLFCPLARAIKRTIGCKTVTVGTHTFSVFYLSGGEGPYPLPEVAVDFRAKFDNGFKYKFVAAPFSFEVTL